MKRQDLELIREFDYSGPSDQKRLWKFLTIPKFISVVANKSLFLCRADLLGDRWEGTYRIAPKDRDCKLDEDGMKQTYVRSSRVKHAFVCSFYHGPHENDGMWRLYASRTEGVAIHFNSYQLAKHLPALPSPLKYHLRKVDYRPIISWSRLRYSIGEVTESEPFFIKDEAFKHEQEARLLLMYDPAEKLLPVEWIVGDPDNPVGLAVPIDIDGAARSIVLAPDMQSWLCDSVVTLARSSQLKIGLSKSFLGDDSNLPIVT